MIALTENPAVIAPRKTLTKREQEALLKVHAYKRQRYIGPGRVQIGPERFSTTTLSSLKRHKLLRGDVPSLSPTDAGELAIERMKGRQS